MDFKKIGLLSLLCCFFGVLKAQSRYAVVDMQAILEKMPAYINVNAQVEKLAKGWQVELKAQSVALQKLKDDYQLDEPFYTENIRVVKQTEIKKKELALMELNTKYFGFEGLYFKKKQQLVKPLQDKIYEVIERVAEDRRFDLVLDKAAAGSLILYISPKLDITLRIMQLLGL